MHPPYGGLRVVRPRFGGVGMALALSVLGSGWVAAQGIPAGERRSDTEAMTPSLQAMQADDFANPGMLAVAEGEALFESRVGGRGCVECHAPGSMRGVAARYPAWVHGRVVDLSGQVETCRTERLGLPASAPESAVRLGLTAYVAAQSRGMPITPAPGAGMEAARARGRTLFGTRMGQLNLSCANCHDANWGRHLVAATIPQGHPVGYPIYRLEWQGMGSLQRRFRGCMTGVRAEPFAPGSAEFLAIEAFLMERAAGLPVETPAVRP